MNKSILYFRATFRLGFHFVTGFTTLLCFALLPSALLAIPYAGVPDNKIASDAGYNNVEFGNAVSGQGNLLLVGAHDENPDFSDQGVAHLYDLTTGAKIITFTADDAEAHDEMGMSVSLFGNLALAGAIREDGAGTNRGAAYLFDTITGDQLSKITASDPQDNSLFGISASLSGNIAVIGAPFADTEDGAAYVYDVSDPENPVELYKLQPTHTAPVGEHFGWSVAVQGNLVVVGAPRTLNSDLTVTGSIYVFDVATGNQLFKLTTPQTSTGGDTGYSVAISGTRAVAGAPNKTGGGAAYVFDLITGNQLFELISSDIENGDEFGFGVAINEEQVFISALSEAGAGSDRGAAYLFDLATGNQLYKYTAADAEDGDELGRSVTFSGLYAIAASEHEDGAGSNRGAVYVYETPSYQPDNLIGRQPFSGSGNDIHNNSGGGQIFTSVSRKLRPAKGWLTVTNDGDRDDSYDVSASAGTNRNFTVRYLGYTGNTAANVTAALRAGTHEEADVSPGEQGRRFYIFVKPKKRLQKIRRVKGRKRIKIQRKTFTTRMTSTSQTFDFKKDTAVFRVKTR